MRNAIPVDSKPASPRVSPPHDGGRQGRAGEGGTGGTAGAAQKGVGSAATRLLGASAGEWPGSYDEPARLDVGQGVLHRAMTA